MPNQDIGWQILSGDIGLSKTYKFPFISDDNAE